MQESLIEKGRAVESGLYLCTSQVVAHKLQITPTNWTMSKPGAFLSPLTLLSFSLTPSHTSVWIILFQKQLQPPPPPPSHTAKLPQDNYQAKIVHHPWGYWVSKKSIQARPQTWQPHFPNQKSSHAVDQRVFLICQLTYLKKFTPQYKLNRM